MRGTHGIVGRRSESGRNAVCPGWCPGALLFYLVHAAGGDAGAVGSADGDGGADGAGDGGHVKPDDKGVRVNCAMGLFTELIARENTLLDSLSSNCSALQETRQPEDRNRFWVYLESASGIPPDAEEPRGANAR